MRFQGMTFQEIARHFNVHLTTVFKWQKLYPEWDDETNKLHKGMEQIMIDKREEILRNWEEWQDKVRQIANANAELAVTQMIMLKQALAQVQAVDGDALERISKATKAGLKEFNDMAISQEKIASAMMDKYFQLEEVLNALNSNKDDETDN